MCIKTLPELSTMMNFTCEHPVLFHQNPCRQSLPMTWIQCCAEWMRTGNKYEFFIAANFDTVTTAGPHRSHENRISHNVTKNVFNQFMTIADTSVMPHVGRRLVVLSSHDRFARACGRNGTKAEWRNDLSRDSQTAVCAAKHCRKYEITPECQCISKCNDTHYL